MNAIGEINEAFVVNGRFKKVNYSEKIALIRSE